MKRALFGFAGMVLSLASITVSAGGWAVITIKDLPDYAVAGIPLRLEFAVRQHGHTLVSGWRSRIDAQLGSRVVSAAVEPLAEVGSYRAEFVFPQTGTWVMTAASGLFDDAKVTMPVISAGAAPPVPAPQERGLRLFAAKGCATCHRHDASSASKSIEAGPVLTARTFPPQLLASRLWKPPACVDGKPCMPNLDLSTNEIAALTAFLNETPTDISVVRR